MDRLNYQNAKSFYGFVRYALDPWTGFYAFKWYQIQAIYFIDHSPYDFDYHQFIQFILAYQHPRNREEWGDNGDEPSWIEWLNSTIAAYNIKRKQVLNRLRELWVESQTRNDITMFRRRTMFRLIGDFLWDIDENINMPIEWHDRLFNGMPFFHPRDVYDDPEWWFTEQLNFESLSISSFKLLKIQY